MSDMHYGAGPAIFKKAKELLDSPTRAEEFLWEKIRRNQLSGFKFRRQHPIANFIADFYCHEVRLVIEVDGNIHDETEQMDYDQGKEYDLESMGLRIIRFKNKEVLSDIDSVVLKIKKVIARTPTRVLC